MNRQNPRPFAWQRIFFLFVGIGACLVLFFSNAYQSSLVSFEGLYPQGDPDVLMHLRRIEQCLLAEGDFAVISKDQYSGFPRVHDYPYAPFLDYMAVHCCRGFYLLFPESGVSFDRVAGWLPVLFGGTFILVFSVWIFSLLQSASLGIIGGFFLASHPYFVLLFQFHGLDHHFLESFFLWCWVICGSLIGSSVDCPRMPALAGAIVWAFLIFSWTGSPLLVTVFSVFVCLTRAWYPPFRAYTQYVAYSLVVGGGAASLITLSNTAMIWHHFRFSLLQPVFSFGSGLLILLFLKTCEFRPVLRRFLWGTGSLTIILGLLQVFGDPIGYMAASHPIMQSIDELQTVFTGFLKTFRLRDLFRSVDPKYVFFPFIFAVAALTFAPRQVIWLCFPVILTTLLGFWQVRYFRWCGAFLVLAQMVFLGFILRKVGFLKEGPWRRKLACSLMGLPLLLMITAGISENPPQGVLPMYEPVVRSSLWLRNHSPDPGGYSDGSAPTYGVLAYWDLGNFIAYYARRPAVCDNLQRGLDYMSRVFLAETASEASRLMDEGRIRYLMVTALEPDVTDELLPVVKDSRFHEDGTIVLENLAERKKNSSDTRDRTLYVNLFQFIGAGNGSSTLPLPRFRLVYVSHDTRGDLGLPPVKIFEHVPGAELHGQTSPGASVTLSLGLTFPFYKRQWQYKLEEQAGSDGRYSFRVPYPTNTYGGGVQTAASYRLKISTADGTKYSQEVEISEDAVLHGKKGIVGDIGSREPEK